MKRRVVVVSMGAMLALAACGQTQAPEEITSGSVTVISEDRPATSNGPVVAVQNKEALDGYLEDTVLSTDLITLTVPEEFKGTFYGKIEGDTISIYDKGCVDAGFPGLVFSLVADKDDSIIPGFMHTKVGEVETSDGETVSVLRGYPSEVQWDYNAEEPETYAKLEDAVDSMIENLQGANGGTYVFKGGTRGEELYSEQIAQYVKAVNLEWGADEYEAEGMSPEFAAVYESEGDKALDKFGFAYVDVTNDGIDELLMGVINYEEGPTPVYDIYTVIDKTPTLVASGTSKDGFYALQYGGVANYYVGEEGESGVISYIIEPGSSDLFFQYGLKLDSNTDKDNPWFISNTEGQWEPMTEEDYNTRYDRISGQYLTLDYKPISSLAN